MREKFPSGSKYARRGVGNVKGRVPRPAVPTAAAPGSPEKVAVLESRAPAGEHLWHDRDHKAERPAERVDTPVCRVAFDDRGSRYR